MGIAVARTVFMVPEWSRFASTSVGTAWPCLRLMFCGTGPVQQDPEAELREGQAGPWLPRCCSSLGLTAWGCPHLGLASDCGGHGGKRGEHAAESV